MANPEWGTKRICQNCSAKFYDLQRDPIVCPKCHTTFDPEAFLKTRRGRTPVVEKEIAPVTEAQIDPDLDAEEKEGLEEDAEGSGAATGEEEEEDLIEDASELGVDDDDMAEVIENVDEEEER